MRHLFIFYLLLGIATILPAQQPPYGDCDFTAGASEDIPKIATRHYGPKANLHDVIPVETSFVKVAYPKGHPKRTDNLPDNEYLQNKIDKITGTDSTLYLVAGKYRLEKNLFLEGNMKIIGQQGAVLSGAQPVNNGWSSLGNNVYARPMPVSSEKIFDDFRCQEKGDTTCRRPNDLFWEGQWLTQLDGLNAVKNNKNSWMFDEGADPKSNDDNRLIVHLPGVTADMLNSGSKLEFSRTIRAFYSNFDKPGSSSILPNISVENLTFEMFTFNGFSAGPNWKVLNCRFVNNHISGLGINDDNYVAQCQMVYNGSTGTGGQPKNANIKDNEIAFNNRAGYDPLWHAGGMKITRATNTVVSNNYVHDNIGPGLWIDVYCDLVKVQNNYLRDNIIGIYYELSQNGIITGNYLERHRTNGIYIVNSPNILVESNTVRYTLNGIVAMQDQRTYNVLCVGDNANTANSMCSRQIRNITVRNNFVELNDVNAVAAGVRVLPGSHPDADTVNFSQERFYKNPDYNFVFDKNKYQYTTSGSNLKNETAFNWGWGNRSPYDPEWEGNGGNRKYSDTEGTRVISWTEWQNVAKKDLASCLNSPNSTAAQWLEAECGSVGSNWQTEDDSQASNGKYLVYLDGNSHLGAPTNSADHVVFSIDVADPGEYSLVARVKAPNSSDDSFWVRVNDGEWQTWSGGVLSSSWSWKKIMGKNYNLRAGTNTITFAYREDGTQLDKVAVQSSSVKLPSGTGATASNCTPTPPPASVVTAFAGADKTATAGGRLTLSGRAEGPNRVVRYQWEKTDGPSVTMAGANTANLNLSNLRVGSYAFRFTATDSEGNSGSDEVKVTVNGDDPPAGSPVTANAGADQTVALGSEPVKLSGTGEGPNPFRAYLWEKVSGPSVRMESGGANLNLYDLQADTYKFKFTATDSEGNSGSDEVIVTVSGSARTASSSADRTSVSDMREKITTLSAYPNPTGDQLIVRLPTHPEQSGVLLLTDLSGKQVRGITPQTVSGGDQFRLDLQSVSSGMYLLRWQADRLYTTKVVVRH